MQCNSPNVTSNELKTMVDALKNLDQKLVLSETVHALNNKLSVNKRKIEKQKSFSTTPKSKKLRKEYLVF